MKSIIKNKKGFLPGLGIASLIVIGIFLLMIVGGVLVFTSINKYAVIGGGLIALVLIFGLRGNMNKTKAWFMGIIIVGALIFILASGTLETVNKFTGEDIVYTVDSGRYECSENSIETTITRWADQNYKFTCGDKELVDNCRVYLSCSGTPWYKSGCGGYGILGTLVDLSYNSLSEGQSNVLYTTLKPGESITLTDDIRNAEYLKIDYEYNPYQLWTIEKGKKVSTNSNDCSLANQNRLTKKNIPYGEWDSLKKGEIRNYFLNWERSYGLKIYEYQGKDILCSTQTLYELTTEKLADGTTRNIQGNPIKYVECCPHQDDNCGDDFNFLPKEQERECNYDYQCANSGDPEFISSSKAKKETCSNEGICVEEVFDVKCNSNAICIEKYGDNFICSESFNTFGECIEGKINQQYCGDGTCGIGETYSNCPSDCEKQPSPKLKCSWYQHEKIQNDVIKKWYNYIGIGEPTIVSNKICATAGWVYGVITGIVVIVLGSLAIIVSKPKKRRRR